MASNSYAEQSDIAIEFQQPDCQNEKPMPALPVAQKYTPEPSVESSNETRKGGEIIRKGNAPYGIVPFALLECRALPPLARLVTAWIQSKPTNWIVRPAALQTALGISEKQWLASTPGARRSTTPTS